MKYRIRKETNWYTGTVSYYLEKYEKRFMFFGDYIWKNAKKYWDICPPYTDDYFDTENEAKSYLKQLTEKPLDEIVFETEI